MEFSEQKFKECKEKAEAAYKQIGEIYCPYLKEKILFNAKGLDHIKLKDWSKPRSKQDQYVRLRLIEIAPKIISQSHTLQEFYETNRMERQKINSRWETRMMGVKYYGFVAIISKYRVKVIVKEISGGAKYFWSLIPFWKTKRDGCENRKILHQGDLETE